VNYEDFNDPLRSEKDVSLAAINPDSSNEDTTLTKQLGRCESTDKTFLLQPHIFTVKELDNEIDDLIDILRNNEVSIRYTSTLSKQGNKPEKVATVIKARKKMNQVNFNWIEERKVDLKNKRKKQLEELKINLKEKISDELNLLRYTGAGIQSNNDNARIINVEQCARNDVENNDYVLSQRTEASQSTRGYGNEHANTLVGTQGSGFSSVDNYCFN